MWVFAETILGSNSREKVVVVKQQRGIVWSLVSLVLVLVLGLGLGLGCC